MWDDQRTDSLYGGYNTDANKNRKYDNLAYAGYEGMDGHRGSNWEANNKADNTDWTDYNGYYGGHYGGYGHGWGYGHHGHGIQKNEEEDNWDDGSNDKEKEGYYTSRDEIKEDTKMLGKLKPEWMRNGWHGYGGYGGYGIGMPEGKGKKGEKKEGDKKEEGKEEGKEAAAEDKAEI